MCGVASALEEVPDDGPPTGAGQGGFGCERGCGPGDEGDGDHIGKLHCSE